MTMAQQVELKAIVHQEGNGYWAEIPALPGCVTEGDTLDELFANVQEAVIGWLEADAKRQFIDDATFNALAKRLLEENMPLWEDLANL